MIHYKYNDKEINELVKSMVIICDTRENNSMHILNYFNQKKVPYEIRKIDTGDYSFKLPANPELGIMRDTYFNSFVERKNSVDEICGNLQKDTQQAFINELIRSQGSRFVIFVEDEHFDNNLAQGKYRSKYDPKALKGRLESLKVKYNFEIVPMDKMMIGHNIYHRFVYQLRHYLKYGQL